ncbi:hypothetical protein [Actinoplanes siamensis]|uniref:Uncharacterized protein n=1 Tax=Actinoplanes siamensis TaxID=1223317 RepID=A0A919NCK2_9ACTN|nr:hypothetical protein [Actinoplanes siamensis]GIF08270.1 hypothetical protein Asi03nite_58080 [Actinoplanes siamensis]
MAERRRLRAWVVKHWRIVFAVCGALIAAVLGAAVQELADNQLRLAAAAAIVVCLLVVALLTGLTATIDSRLQADRELLTTIRGTTVEHRRLAGSTDRRIAAVRREIAAMAANVGMRADALTLSELNEAKSVETDRTRQLMGAAKEEILILDLLLEDGSWPNEAMDAQYQADAFESFDALVRQTSPGISYRRIIQVVEPESSLRHARTPQLVKHCHHMVGLQRARAGKVSLRVTRRRFPFKFIIVDRTAVVLQLQEYGDDPGALRIWGEVLINDPGGQLVAVFRAIWDEFVDHPSTRTVTVADLPPPGDAAA